MAADRPELGSVDDACVTRVVDTLHGLAGEASDPRERALIDELIAVAERRRAPVRRRAASFDGWDGCD